MKASKAAVVLLCLLAQAAIVPAAMAQAPCNGDLDGDRTTDGTDLGTLLAQWGTPGSADLSADGVVDGIDLGQLLSNWGACPTVTPAWAAVIEALPDPTVVTDPSLRQAIIASGWAWRIRDSASQIELMLVPPGTFRMGCTERSDLHACGGGELPVRQVRFSRAVYLGRYEVRQAEWSSVMGSNPSYFNFFPDAPRHPVERVSWTLAQEFMSRTGLRLPTEAEWEYACRAGTSTAFNNGSNDDATLGSIAWTMANSEGRTRPVGSKPANRLGLHDMHGNVWEWVTDRYGPYAPEPQEHPVGSATGTGRVARGGAYFSPSVLQSSSDARSSNRIELSEGQSGSALGFRVARTPNSVLRTVRPASGPTAGGTTITLTGENLSGTTAVLIGGKPCSNAQVEGDGSVSATIPRGQEGAFDVAIVTASGTASMQQAFTYLDKEVPSWATLLEPAPNREVITDPGLRQAIAASPWAWRVRDIATGIELLLVPAGSFDMGCTSGPPGECQASSLPVHAVTLTRDFYLGRYETTQWQWTALMGQNPSRFQSPSAQVPATEVPSRPVENVTWNDVQSFMARTGLRLPTEAEWEYACRAGTTSRYNNGSDSHSTLGEIAWHSMNSLGQTRPAGRKAANRLGFHDMHGNVAEWTEDWYSDTYYAESTPTDPPGPPLGTSKSWRGGWWNGGPIVSHGRGHWYPDSTEFPVIGFRVARTP